MLTFRFSSVYFSPVRWRSGHGEPSAWKEPVTGHQEEQELLYAIIRRHESACERFKLLNPAIEMRAFFSDTGEIDLQRKHEPIVPKHPLVGMSPS
jgi:hypothetical protein